jgi:molybdenum cofactor cytidylyltransferase
MICAIVLAAGRSGRMGTQKLLLPLENKPVVAHVVDALLRSSLERTVVVVGRDGARVREALGDRNMAFIQNPDTEGEMLGSIRCGLRALPASCAAVLVALGDQPGVTAELVSGLVRAFRETGRGIIVPAYHGKRGHPILFATRFRDEVLSKYDGIGLRSLLDAHPAEVLEVPVSVASVLEDMDTPEDYERQKKRKEGEFISSQQPAWHSSEIVRRRR